ncbi:MAG: leucine--tRNA ligase [Nanoarchaeota archaeon]
MVDSDYDFRKVESKWQKKWEDKKAFEVEPDKRKKFFITTPYPYISGSLHIGHGRATVETDVYSRFKRMNGFNVLYPLAFHITGTPVLGISAAIKNGNKEMIELYERYVSAYIKDKKKVKDVVKSFVQPQKIVDFFIPKMISEYKQLGLGVDWRRSFTSGDFEHQEMVNWQFHKYHDNGFLVKKDYPLLYSPSDESAMGEDDIKDGDTDPVEKVEFTLLKFSFKKKILVAATLRPETIFGQTNLWVNPSVEYHEAKVGDEVWIISKESLEKLKHQRKDITILGRSKEKLIGEYATSLAINKKLIILPSSFVDGDYGTGIVTSVPSDAPYDYVALRELQDNKKLDKAYGFSSDLIREIEDIEIIPIIRTEKYGDKAGVSVVELSKALFGDDKKLEKLTQDVYKEGFHKGFLNDNCGKYKDMSVKDAKEKMKDEMIKKGTATTMFETSRKAFSRSGGKIIVAVMDDQWFLDFNSLGWKDKARKCLEKVSVTPDNFKKQFFDTIDWLDKRPCARRRGLGTVFPFDKKWIIESLSDSTIYMTLYTINHLIKEHGLKRDNLKKEFFDFVYLGEGNSKSVSKIIGVKESVLKEIKESFDYWMPVDQRHTYYLHLSNHLSFMIFAFASLFPEKSWPKSISLHGVIISGGTKMSKSKGNVVTLLDINENYGSDVFRFYVTQSASVEGTLDWRNEEVKTTKNTFQRLYYEMMKASNSKKKGVVRPLFESKFNKILRDATLKISDMKLREYNTLAVFDMLRLVKDAKSVMGDESKELFAFYDLIIDKWVRLIAPTCPHIAEEVWEKLGNKDFVSLADWPSFDGKKIDEKLELQEGIVDKTIEDINNITRIIKEKSGIDATKVFVYVLPKEKDLFDESFFTKKLGMETKVFAVNDSKKYDPQGKSSKAKPGKPAIYVQ